MKKYILLMITVLMMAFAITACGSADNNGDNVSTGEKLSVVTTIFPEYDWVREIVGDTENVEITMLLDSGVDLHSFQPTADDIIKIANCDMFIYVGGESDGWVEDALAEAVNKDMKVINLLEVLGDTVKTEELKEGMQESEHNHEHNHSHGKEVSTFEDNEVQDRELSDWAGEWQSGYPLILDGSLDKAFEIKAADSDKMTAEEYKEYYTTGYKTDYTDISIVGDNITFTDKDGNKISSDYKYVGYYIQDWSTGTRAAMYRFEAVDKASGAPIFIQFNDHMIEPAESEHFHIRMSNDSFDAIPDPENYWPTFYPAELTPEEVCEELAGHGKHSDEDDHDHENEADHDHENEADHDHEEAENDHDHEEAEYDEHVWLSLKNAKVLCVKIAESLAELDGKNADKYKSNADTYVKKLDELDAKYESTVAESSKNTILVGDRFPFRYMVDDYGLDYFAAFVGCSADSEASFETVTFLSGKTDELGLGTVLKIESSDGKIAETIRDNTAEKNQQILTLDSMQSVNSSDVDNGATYISIMEKNLETLKEALK